MAAGLPAAEWRGPTRSRAIALVLVLAVLSTLSPARAAQAAPVYEITGDWIAPPATIASGNPVVADWRFNINDDQPAPSNDPVDNVTAVFTIGNAFFDELPDLCQTTDVDPPSSISDDGTILTCNFGTLAMGTALAVQTPVIADGPTGSQLTMDGSYNGLSVDLPPIPIVNTFGMDMLWGTPTSYYDWNAAFTAADVEFNWTLLLDKGADQGPNSVTYRLDLGSDPAGRQFNVGPNPIQGGSGCTPHMNSAANGHPLSGRPDVPARNAPFVGTCTLVERPGQPNVFDLTLTGIDYSETVVPVNDSANQPMPIDQVAVAAGSLWFRVFTDTRTAVTLEASAPTYTSTTGLTDVDDPINNTSNKVLTLPGSWSAAWHRAFTSNGGTPWDDTYRLPPGELVRQYVNVNFQQDNADPDDLYGNCLTLDTAFVTFVSDGVDLVGFTNPHPIEYYVGNHPSVTPGSGAYNPDVFDCGIAGGWTTTEPANLATVKAVRVSYPFSELTSTGSNHQLRVHTTINEDAPVGQDIWMFGSHRRLGTWGGPGLGNDQIDTPGARYPTTTGRRDILRVISAEPYIEKAADRSTVTPGVPAVYTLTYSANGSGSIPPIVDGYVIRDVLPVGMTYVVGTTSPDTLPGPSITMDAQDRQVLTWTLSGVTTNAEHALTYQAVADSSIEPGSTLTNTVTSSVSGATSNPATATVTSSTNGYTLIGKSPDQAFIPNPTADGIGTGSWTVTLRSVDPTPQAYTDTIDILPYIGDGRGTAFNGSYALEDVTVPAGATAWYTDAPPATLVDDPADPSNGAAGNPAGSTVGWTTTRPATVTAVRVIGPELPPGDTFQFQVSITTDGALGGDTYVNRAQARAEHTELVMRTSAPTIMASFYSASLKKYVQDRNGVWHDANEAADYVSFELGEEMPYRIVITNTGQGTLTNFDITDDQFPEESFHVDELEGGESETHEFTVIADESHLGTFVNTACATVDTPFDAEAAPEIPCDPAGIEVAETGFDKVLVDVVPNGDGTSTVTYDLVVTRRGLDGVYRLTDTLRYGTGTTVVDTTVVNTEPGDIDTNDAWDGTTDPEVVPAELIAADATHTYRATVIVAVDAQAATTESSDCTLGGGEAGTGFLNQARLEIDDKTFDDEECAEFPAITHTKELAGDPVRNNDGTYTVAYDIVVTNHGSAAGPYDLDDRLVYGAGISVRTASVANTAPGGVATNPAWNGISNTLVVSERTLEPGASDHYAVTVRADVPSSITAAADDCVLTAGEDGTGFRNESTLTSNGSEQHDDACAPPSAALGAAASRLPRTGADLDALLPAGLAFLLAGWTLLLGRRRSLSGIV